MINRIDFLKCFFLSLAFFSSYRIVSTDLRKCCPLNFEFSFPIEYNVSAPEPSDDIFTSFSIHTPAITLIDSDNFSCVPVADGALFTTIWSESLTVGLPRCSSYELVVVDHLLDNSKLTACLDRHRETGKIVGIVCSHEPQHGAANASKEAAETSPPTVTVSDLGYDAIIGQQSKFRYWIAGESGASIANVPIAPIVSLRKCCPSFRSYDTQNQFCWNKYASNNNSTVPNLIKLTVKKKVESFVNVSLGVPACDWDTEVLTDIIVRYNRLSISPANSVIVSSSDGVGDKPLVLSFEDYCVDLTDDIFENVVIRYCEDYREVCRQRKKLCIRKCCPDGQMINYTKQCDNSQIALDLTFYRVPANGHDLIPVPGLRPSYLYGLNCKKFPLHLDGLDEHYLTDHGYLYLPYDNQLLDDSQYCVENVGKSDILSNRTYMFRCFVNTENETQFVAVKHVAVFIGAIFSSVFLLFTFLVYVCLPALQNLHGKTVMCYVATLFLGYVILAVIHLPIFDYSTLCTTLGYTLLFAFLSSFCWMNVICFDIWSTFGAIKSAFVKRSGTRNRFILYRLYGWGVPLVWTGMTFICQFTDIMEDNSVFKPDIRKNSCWFDDLGKSRMIFFILPISLIIICNTVLFVMTVIYCSKVRSAISAIQNNDYVKKKFIRDKHKLIMNSKLFIAMGINWGIEAISLTLNPEQRQFFLFADVINASGGILIFIIFIMKRKILNNLKRKFCTSDDGNIKETNIGLRSRFSASVLNTSLNSSTSSPCRSAKL